MFMRYNKIKQVLKGDRNTSCCDNRMKYNRQTYRYILSGTIHPDDMISKYKIIAQNKFPEENGFPISQAIRFLLPSDMALKQTKGESFSTTEDARTLRDIDAKIVVKVNGRWKESFLGMSITNTSLGEINNIMKKNQYYISPYGYLDNDRYRYFVNHYSISSAVKNEDGSIIFNYGTYNDFDNAYKTYKD